VRFNKKMSFTIFGYALITTKVYTRTMRLQ